ncbi:MAG: hypothetical protein JST19_06780 [Bacteroidetes bacterium]|nr:hypothetical protein [Bacteroidota bacterium]
MRKLLFITPLIILFGCGKTTPVKPNIVLTGTYVSYREIDTMYTAFNPADGIESINVWYPSGDSVYNYPGTKNANSGFSNTITDNAAANGQASITFNSTTTATMNQTSYVPVYITYDLKKGTYNDGRLNERERIIVVNSNTIELLTNPLSVDNQPNTSGYLTAIYFRKQ